MKKATMLSALFCVVFLGLSFGKEALSKDQLLNPQNTNKQKIERKEAILISSIKSAQVINHIENDQNQNSDTNVSVEDIKSQVINQINNNTEKVDKKSIAINSLPNIMGKTILENQSTKRTQLLINDSSNNAYRALYNLSVGGGSWGSEVSWSVSSDGTEVLSGGVGDWTDVELADGDYFLTMNDSYGDGWNGNTWVLSTSAGTLYTFGLESGSEGTADFSLPGEVDTTVYGCMLEGAPNYNPEAEEDDGTCEFYAGANYGYWNPYYEGYQIGCGLYYIFADSDFDGIVDAQGNGACDNDLGGFEGYGLACEAFDCDGGDCLDCNNECAGDTPASTECWDGSLACSEDDCPDFCTDSICEFLMYDSYGDGWNGASFEGGGQSATLDEGSEGMVLLCFDLSLATDFSVGGGSWDSEITWTLDCADGNPLSGGAPEEGCVGALCGDVVPSGCTDMGACNYDPDAVEDDGTCEYADGVNVLTDCDGTCFDASLLSWVGDGYCDDGAFGVDFVCLEYECDLGDCGDAPGDDGECGQGDDCLLGDNNDDETINVQDIILVVNYIMGVSNDDLPCADMNDDGTINVQDIVSIVNIIMGTSARVDSATEATLVIRNNDLLLRSDGFVQGVQLTLSHGTDFTITLENEYVSEYVTSENQTTVVLVTDGLNTLEKIGDTRGVYTILSSVVSDNNGNSILTNQTTEISNFMLTEAYPNPFNPTTNLSLVLSEAGYVSVKIYNIVGQQVAVLADGMYEANVNGHQLTWDASNISSGVYIVRAESSGQVSTQKLMLLK